MKTSRYIQNFTATSHYIWPVRSGVTHIRESHYCSKYKQKMNDTGHLGRKLDDSLPDFVTFVVSRFWKWGKRGGNQHITVDLRGEYT
ncbi:hypothetical protein P2H57_14275 [Citrobacter freundii]|uniref:hypothetical protein n=1 Tax=Citrobacter TaxID=544 RepID=UPI00142E7FF4|nr:MULTISPECIES: hypothetical protein [Citrobacter]MDK2360353.1 hypothetical protein [Citrobacter freundii]MDM2929543.1 hypothetical protein [Citrobacter sp. Cm046]MDM2943548.1 hypothetical protein [Citrobacter sp. Cm038]HEB0856431.1 hypothetical protein [Citrobacter freundii]